MQICVDVPFTAATLLAVLHDELSVTTFTCDPVLFSYAKVSNIWLTQLGDLQASIYPYRINGG